MAIIKNGDATLLSKGGVKINSIAKRNVKSDYIANSFLSSDSKVNSNAKTNLTSKSLFSSDSMITKRINASMVNKGILSSNYKTKMRLESSIFSKGTIKTNPSLNVKISSSIVGISTSTVEANKYNIIKTDSKISGKSSLIVGVSKYTLIRIGSKISGKSSLSISPNKLTAIRDTSLIGKSAMSAKPKNMHEAHIEGGSKLLSDSRVNYKSKSSIKSKGIIHADPYTRYAEIDILGKSLANVSDTRMRENIRSNIIGRSVAKYDSGYYGLDILPNKEPIKPKISIAKPNRSIVGNLAEAYEVKQTINLGNLNEITFKVPYEISIHGQLKDNENIDKLKERFLIRVNIKNNIEWFIINEIKEVMDNNGDSKEIHAFSLGHELNDKEIRDYEVLSYNSTQILSDVLSETIWSVGYVDSYFDIRYRSLEVSSETVLGVIYKVAETFGGIVEFDTVNRRVNLKRKDYIGTNKGLLISYGKYMKSMNKESNPDEMVTRLNVYGKDELSIRSVNPIGTSYIEDFSYFMYPFQRDTNNNTIQSSYYMSDGLCHAILDYKELIESKNSDFSNLLDNLETRQESLALLETEMTNLQNDMAQILDELDVAKATGGDTTLLEQERSDKQYEIDQKQSEIDSIKAEIESLEVEIKKLRTQLSVESNFTVDQIAERNQYIIERTWSDDSYINAHDLYKDAVERFEEIKKPKTVFDIDIVNFLEIVEAQRDWSKLNLGDEITIRYDKLNINVTAKIVEINFDYDNKNIGLKIANVKEIDKLIEMLYKSHSTSTSVDMSKYKWDKANQDLGEINEIINNTWDATKREIVAGINETVSISRRGIKITDTNDPNTFLVAQNSVLAITNDGGNTWKNAITGSGIVGERIFGKIIAGVNLVIENDSGKFRFDSNGATIDGASLNIIGGQNGINLDSDTGMTITRSDDKSKIKLNSTDGFAIEKKDVYGNWVKNFYVDIDGNMVANDLTAERLIMRNGGDVLIDGKTRVIDFTNFHTIVGKLTADNIDATNIEVQSINITGKLTGDQIDVDSLKAKSIKADKLELKGIDVTDTLTGLSTLTIDKYGNLTVNGDITGGTISGVQINVDTDLVVGDNIYLGDLTSKARKSIVFTGNASVSSENDDVFISAQNFYVNDGRVQFGAGKNLSSALTMKVFHKASFHHDVDFTDAGVIDFTGAEVLGLGVAKFG